MATKAKDTDETQSEKPTNPTPKSNGEKRKFQLQSGEKVDLTREEAEKEGFFWKS